MWEIQTETLFNIKTDLREMGYEEVKWVGLGKSRIHWPDFVVVMMMMMILPVLVHYGICCSTVSCSGKNILQHGVSRVHKILIGSLGQNKINYEKTQQQISKENG
jgi:hypothetical protein